MDRLLPLLDELAAGGEDPLALVDGAVSWALARRPWLQALPRLLEDLEEKRGRERPPPALPQEIWLHVVEFGLDEDDLGALACVSRAWNAVLSDWRPWRRVARGFPRRLGDLLSDGSLRPGLIPLYCAETRRSTEPGVVGSCMRAICACVCAIPRPPLLRCAYLAAIDAVRRFGAREVSFAGLVVAEAAHSRPCRDDLVAAGGLEVCLGLLKTPDALAAVEAIVALLHVSDDGDAIPLLDAALGFSPCPWRLEAERRCAAALDGGLLEWVFDTLSAPRIAELTYWLCYDAIFSVCLGAAARAVARGLVPQLARAFAGFSTRVTDAFLCGIEIEGKIGILGCAAYALAAATGPLALAQMLECGADRQLTKALGWYVNADVEHAAGRALDCLGIDRRSEEYPEPEISVIDET